MTGELPDRLHPPAAVAAPARGRWLILAVAGVAQLMVVLDATIVNIALPSAQQALGFSVTDRQWVVTAYALAFGGLLLVGGRLSDLFGRKRTFIAGLAGFAAASAAGGAAPGFGSWWRRGPCRARSPRCWRRPRWPCLPRRSPTPGSAARRWVSTPRSPAAGERSGCCSAAC
jgi:hypothetical protein